MPTFTACTRAGHNGPNLLLELTATDGKAYQFEITPHAFTRLFVMGWQAAAALPEAPDRGDSAAFQSKLSLAFVNMQPGLVIWSGPLVLSMLLDERAQKTLRDGMKQFFSKDQGQKH